MGFSERRVNSTLLFSPTQLPGWVQEQEAGCSASGPPRSPPVSTGHLTLTAQLAYNQKGLSTNSRAQLLALEP